MTPAHNALETIHHWHFRFGIAVVLTLGAAWGAYLLLQIASAGSFTAVALHDVNAHGHAQIFGWVGLFVMGFAYAAFPRFKAVALPHRGWAWAGLWLMLVGVAGRCIAEPLAGRVPWAGPVAVGATGLEVVAIGLFAWIVWTIFRRSALGWEAHDYYVLAAVGWFFLQAVAETCYLAATLAAADRSALLTLVATWQAPLREIQIHGFAMLMILGVSQRIFPRHYGFRATGRRKSLIVLAVLNAAVVGEALGLVWMQTAGRVWAGLWFASVLAMAVAAAVLLQSWRIFSPCAQPDRSLKFLRAAYVWLFVSLGMLVLLPAYQQGLLRLLAPDSGAAQIGFSHAYYGAVRHAITVGFISLMIMGVSAKMVPTLLEIDPARLRPLRIPFVLLNVGCALRVGAQTLTDFTPAAFPAAGASGLLELGGLAVWGVHLWRLMSPTASARPGSPDRADTADHERSAGAPTLENLVPSTREPPGGIR